MKPKAQFKEGHINKDRLYEVDEIVSNSKADPSTIIPDSYWEEWNRLMKFFERLPSKPTEKAPF